MHPAVYRVNVSFVSPVRSGGAASFGGWKARSDARHFTRLQCARLARFALPCVGVGRHGVLQKEGLRTNSVPDFQPPLEAPWPDLLQPASTGQTTAVPRGPFPTSTLVQQFSAGRRIPRTPLEAPWPGLWRPGERAMEGPFSPSATGRRVGTARSERPRPGLARRAPPWGCPFFGTFLWASKERYSPARDAGCSKCAA